MPANPLLTARVTRFCTALLRLVELLSMVSMMFGSNPPAALLQSLTVGYTGRPSCFAYAMMFRVVVVTPLVSTLPFARIPYDDPSATALRLA
jgi:hypothetical protein